MKKIIRYIIIGAFFIAIAWFSWQVYSVTRFVDVYINYFNAIKAAGEVIAIVPSYLLPVEEQLSIVGDTIYNSDILYYFMNGDYRYERL